MDGNTFREWQKRTGLNGRQLSEMFGKSTDTIATWRTHGVTEASAKLVELAFEAICARLKK